MPDLSLIPLLTQGAESLLAIKGVNKLIETVSEQISLTLKPWHTRRQGDADDYVTLAKERTQASVTRIKADTKVTVKMIELGGKQLVADFKARAVEASRTQSERRQANKEMIVAGAINELERQSADVSDTSVDNDWVSQFFNYSQDTTNEKMRSVWSRVLAGEVLNPGTFSLRTLHAVRMLTEKHAKLFMRLGTTIWVTDLGPMPVQPLVENDLTNPSNLLSSDELQVLDWSGLIKLEGAGTFDVPLEKASARWTYFNRICDIKSNSTGDIMIGAAKLTDIGQELMLIAQPEPDDEYFKWIVNIFRSKGCEVIVNPTE